jgi:broad specificity phosphatase PhoE
MNNKLPKITFLLIRHAQARSSDGIYNPNTPLSDLGKEQAKLLTNALSETKIDVIYSSPFPRAYQTAEPLSNVINKPIIKCIEIQEFEMADKPLQIIEYRSDLEIWKPNQQGKPNGETVSQFFTRVALFCDKLCERHNNETIAIYTHAGTIDAIFRWAIGIKFSEPWLFELDISNASITEFIIWPKGRMVNGAPRYTALQRIGDIHHLNSNVSNI